MRIFRFGPFELDENLMELRRDGVRVELQDTPFRVLRALLENRDRVVPKDHLLAWVWPDAVVSDAAVSTALKAVRRALGDDGDRQVFIETRRGQGYRFVARASVVEHTRTEPSAPDGVALLSSRPLELLGREDEIARIGPVIEAASRGSGGLVLLDGPAGIGKTRLAEEVGRVARAAHMDVHACRALGGERTPPLWLWAELVRSLASVRDDASFAVAARHAAPELADLVPDLAKRLPGGRHLPTGALAGDGAFDAARFGLLNAVAGFIETCVDERPTALVLEDLQWADEPSLGLLALLAARARARPLLIVTTRRSVPPPAGEHARQMARALREPHSHHVELGSWSPEVVQRALDAVLGRSAGAELRDRVVTATGGLPLFVIEVGRWLAQHPHGEPARLPIPTRVRDAIDLGLSERSAACCSVLRVASVIGETFGLGVLNDTSGLEPRRTLDALAEAERAGLVVAEDAHTYRFNHGLVRDALVASLDLGDRTDLHRRIGDAIERRAGAGSTAHLAQIAHHFAEAAPLGKPERAVAYCRAAGAAAARRSAHEDAAAHYARALHALSLVPSADASLRCALLLDHAEALIHAHGPLEGALAAVGDALDVACEADDPGLLARGAVLAASYDVDLGAALGAPTNRAVDDPHLPRLRDALARLGPDDTALRARVLLAMVQVLLMRRRIDEAQTILDEAEQIAERAADRALLAETLRARIDLLPSLLESDVQSALLDRLETVTCGHPRLAWYVATRRARLALERGDRASLERERDALERLLTTARVPVEQWLSLPWSIVTATLDGDLPAAERAVGRLAGSMDGTSFAHVARLCAWTHLSMIHFLAGSTAALEAGVRLLPATLRTAESSPLLVLLLVEAGRREEAHEVWRESDLDALVAMPRDDRWLPAIQAAGEACAAIGDRQSAKGLFEWLEPHADRVGSLGPHFGCTGPIARTAGSLAALAERWEDCDRLFERAIALCKSLRSPVWRAITEVDWAVALRGHPDARTRARILELSESALDAATQLGLGSVRARHRRAFGS